MLNMQKQVMSIVAQEIRHKHKLVREQLKTGRDKANDYNADNNVINHNILPRPISPVSSNIPR